MANQEHIRAPHLLDALAQPRQRDEDIERRQLIRPQIETAKRGLVGDGVHFQTECDRPVLIRYQRHIPWHHACLLDPQHDLSARRGAQPPRDGFTQDHPLAGSTLKGVFPEANRIELVIYAKNLDPVDALRAILVRNDAGGLENGNDRASKLLLQLVGKSRTEESPLRKYGELDLSEAGLKGLLQRVLHGIADRQSPGEHARGDNGGQENREVHSPIEPEAPDDKMQQIHGCPPSFRTPPVSSIT